MVLSSWLFVLGKLKLLFFLWRREQHELSPWGEEDREDPREPDLFITEISKQFDWNVCSSTNSWFYRGERVREEETERGREKEREWTCCRWIIELHLALPARPNSKQRCLTVQWREKKRKTFTADLLNSWKMFHHDIWTIWSQLSRSGAICENIEKCYPSDRLTKLEGHDSCVLRSCQ